MVNAWDRRADESKLAHDELMKFCRANRAGRIAQLAKSTNQRRWAERYDWAARAAVWDDAHEQWEHLAATEAVREMRAEHARVGRHLLDLAVDKMEADGVRWQAADLIRLADLGRKMEAAAHQMTATTTTNASGRTVVTGASGGDEWDRLAAELAGTIPT